MRNMFFCFYHLQYFKRICNLNLYLIRQVHKSNILNATVLTFKLETLYADQLQDWSYVIPKDVTLHNQYEMIAQVATPLWKVPYSEQLQLKFEASKNILNFLAKSIKLRSRTNKRYEGLPLQLEMTKPSPVTENYRNKDEFMVQYDVNGNPKTVGLAIGKGRDGDIICVSPDYIIVTKENHKKVANAYQTFLRQHSLPACHYYYEGGHWRQIIVRSNCKGEIMAVVFFHPQTLNLDDITSAKEAIKEFFITGEGKECNLSSLYFQVCPNRTCNSHPFDLLHGQPYIFEELYGLKFRISPQSFFQINTKAAEVLYEVVKDLCNPGVQTQLLDLCCGTGTISTVMAPHVKQTLGIEVCAQAVEDAKYNAALNNIFHAEFIHGKVEKTLKSRLAMEDTEDLVVVVNPSRAGLLPQVIRSIRNCRNINRLVYVSCKPINQGMRNFINLCSNNNLKNYPGKPFLPTKAVPVDLFPHTFHFELAILFER